ncbi:MAG: type II secretion system secretin GspD, partial [Mariprofundaceae bacterium]|nr:type II secretion system secretin GspD [Mariprofundaceae bacterium]
RARITLLFLMAALAWHAAWAADDMVTLNFSNADIQSVIKFVSEFSGRNFLVDRRVKGRVTVVSPAPITREAAYGVFLSILEVNGFAAVPSGEVVKIVPAAEARQKGLPVESGEKPGGGDALMTQVITLRHADAMQVANVFRPLVSSAGNLSAFAPANTLILTDTAANIRRIMEIVQALDISETVGFKVIGLKHASAEKLAQLLNELYGRPSARNMALVRGGAAPAGAAVPARVIAYVPANRLIAIGSGALLDEITSVVARLDVAPKLNVGRLQVRYLKNADAGDMAKVLNELIGRSRAPAQAGKGAVFSGDVKVVADKATNALLITADSADRKAINAIIDRLDIRRLQVLVEALIVEVSGGTAQQFGIEWRAMSDFTRPGRKPFGGTAFSSQSGANINTVAANPLSAGRGLVVGVVEGTVSFGGVEFANIGALVRALEAQADTNVLSTPNILTMDNEEAEIIVGQNVPFVTGSYAQATGTTGTAVNPFQTIERKDIGLTLRVTPQISEGDTIRLEIYQEVSSLDASADLSGASDLIPNKRSVKTVVLARDKQFIVLGGLMRDDVTVSVQRVPCAGRIPLIGEAFKFTENTKRKTNLMVFLRPHIIKSATDIEAITQKKYLDIRDVYERSTIDGTIVFPTEKPPFPKRLEELSPSLKTDDSLPEADGATP